ncbi:MAG: SDR family NAD(P)-dependent oxidoreductase, partial [Terriglobales bacterium]
MASHGDKKVALVTGANRCIGLETARQLGKEGITVVVAARSLAAANETAERLKAEGLDVFPVKLDVTSAEDRAAAAKAVSERYGKLDILINNAGVGAEDGMFAGKTIET